MAASKELQDRRKGPSIQDKATFSNLILIALLQTLLLRGGLSSPHCTRRTVSLQCREVTQLPSNGGWNVIRVDVAHNRITTIGDNFFQGFESVRTFLAAHNEITTVTSGAFARLANLTMVDLSFNRLTTLRNDVFADNGRLEVLYLRGNPLTVPAGLPILQSDSLRKLVADHTEIVHFTETTFSLVRNVVYMTFEGNAVVEFSHEAVKALYKLEKIVLGKPVDADCYQMSVFKNLRKIRERTDLDAEICPSVATSTTAGSRGDETTNLKRNTSQIATSTVAPTKAADAGNTYLLEIIMLVICLGLIFCVAFLSYKIWQLSPNRHHDQIPSADND